MSRAGDQQQPVSLEPGEVGLYSRHLLMPAIGIQGQLALKAASVLMVGAGGLGCPALLYLAAAGVGRLGIIDADRIEVSNVHRQVLFRTTDKGENKADVAKARLQALNPYIHIQAYVERFNIENAAALVADYDIVIDGTDNFTAKYLINDACCLGANPWCMAQSFSSKARSRYSTRCRPTASAAPITAICTPSHRRPPWHPIAPRPECWACCRGSLAAFRPMRRSN